MKIAITAPRMGIRNDTPGGMIKAISMPVKAALPSLTVTGRPSIFWQTTSTAMQLSIDTAVISSTWIPKTNTDNTSGGTRQATTVHMILSTDSELRTCGETETFHVAAAIGAWFSLTFGSMTKLLASLVNWLWRYERLAFIFASRTNCTSGRLAGQT